MEVAHLPAHVSMDRQPTHPAMQLHQHIYVVLQLHQHIHQVMLHLLHTNRQVLPQEALVVAIQVLVMQPGPVRPVDRYVL